MGVGFWARTWHWGDLISDVSFHDLAVMGVNQERDDLKDVMERSSRRVHEAAFRALRDFPDDLPCQVMEKAPNGGIGVVKSDYFNERAQEHRKAAGYDRDSFPPQVMKFMPGHGGSDAYLEAILEAFTQRDDELCFDWSDDLNPFAVPRYARDSLPNVWQYVANPRVRSFRDVRVGSIGQHRTGTAMRVPDGETAARQIRDHLKNLNAAFSLSYPDLPEGYEVYSIPAVLSVEQDI